MFYHQTYNLEPFNPKSAEFGVWSTHEIKKLSVAKINTFVCFDNVGYPVAGGLHDARLGPLKFQSDPCLTCGNNMMKCLGHFGHIELPVPVVNPLFAAIVANVLKISCLSCFSAIIREPEKTVLTTQLRLVELGCLVEAHKLDQYLEQYNDKSVAEVKQDMAQLYEKLTATYGADHTPKNIDSVWRHYVGRIFRRGAAKKCPNCKKTLYKVTFIAGRFYISCRTIGKEKLVRTHLMPATIMEHMRKLWPKESDLLKALIKALSSSTAEYPTDLCFISVVPVTPSNTRPIQMVRGKSVEHPKNIMYRQILQDCMQIRNIVQVLNGKEVGKEVETLVEASRGDSPNEKLHYKWHELQINVNALLDANALKGVINTSLGVSRIGVKQLIEKKVGIMRKNMMGKRVDYFARSVITPDPLLNINEIGVPQAFAKKLTFPVPVTPWNVTELREMVMRGPGSYPGANVVEADDGSLIWISETNVESRRGLAKTLLTPRVDSSGPKVVHRHLLDGDMLLINRQPSLHKPSIMAHEARILQKEKTFRLHYANCKAYNADFDGDEMNAHFPQNELARAEASEIMNACHQYLVPRDGTPLSGLIQDHVISAFRLTVRGKFFNRREYHQLVYQALCFLVGDIKLLPPAILKPQCLWSGKQVISTLIINLTPASYVPLNLYSTTKVRFNAWPSTQQAVQYCSYMSDDERKFMSETNVVIRGGELLCGVLDKNHVGATHYGLVHSFYELYGGQYSANILSALSRLLTHYLQQDGFSLGVLDIMVQRKADRQRRKMVDGLEEAGVLAARNALGVPADEEIDSETLLKRLEIAHKKNTNFRALVDHEYKNVLDKITNDVNKVCLPLGLAQPFPANNLQLMVQSGAKGSTVNTMQISCLLGQIELEGKRPPLMISGKSLPSFRPYDPSPVAGGFIASRFMSGIRPQEFFFHCMAGREGLIDTAVKTSRSGYLQRCLVKHLEGLVVNYDLTVRDSDNSVIQFRYGEDGLDIPKSQLLNLEQLPFFADNIDALYNEENFAPLKEGTAKRELRNQKNNIEATKSIRESVDWKKHRDSAFLRFCSEMANESELLQSQESLPGRSNMSYALCNLWYSMHEDVREKYARMSVKCPDPVISNFAPDVYFGSVSENTEEMLRRYFKDNKGNLPVRKSKFKEAVYWKSFTSLCQPGEPVGVLAAQSVGEPSTQMTLNTFHFAGRGEMNVTLGIPRLREILMVASRKIKTPCTEIPFRPDVHRLEKRAEKLRKSLMRVVLRDVLEKITVKEMISSKKKIRKYQLQLHYLPRKSYSSDTNIKPIHIIKCVETRFISSLEQMLKKHLTKNYSGEMKIADRVAKHVGVSDSEDDEDDNFDNEFLAENREKKTVNDDSDDDNSDAEGDGDASEARLRRRQIDGQEYDEDDDDDDDDDDQEFEVSTNFLNEEKNSDDDEIADGPLSTTNTESVPVSRKSKSQFEIITPNFGVKEAQHDPASNSWTKIELWASLSYKRLDLSSLLPKEAGNVVIHEIPGIKRAITYVNNDGLLTLKTEGSYGISELFKHDRLLDLNKLYSNDVHAVADNFGIEAANRVLIREVQDVFKVYGITVDPRHLTLIADYMTFDGTYQGLNRTGMDNCPSPMQQMTFETTLKYLRNATLRNLKDNLQSPSSSIMLGLNSKIGAGLIHLHCR